MIHEHIEALAGHRQSHASSLLELDGGDLLAAWFAGSREGNGDVGIWGARRDRKRWGGVSLLAKVNGQPHWNPVLHRSGDEVLLFFKTGPNCSRWRTWVQRSADQGRTWGAAELLVPGNLGGRGPVKNKCLELSDGTLLAAGSSEIGRWRAFVDRSADGGRTWRRSALLEQSKAVVGTDKDGRDVVFGVIQPTLWESAPGKAHMLLRSNCGRICRSDSDDGGLTWSRVYETGMPNNNSGIDLAKLRDGSLVLAYNPEDTNWGSRSTLTLARSADNGASWRTIRHLAEGVDKEFSYPAVIALRGGGVAVSYTWNREAIAVALLSRAELVS